MDNLGLLIGTAKGMIEALEILEFPEEIIKEEKESLASIAISEMSYALKEEYIISIIKRLKKYIYTIKNNEVNLILEERLKSPPF